MPYIQGFDRQQMMMCTWDSFVEPDSIARLIDAFVDSLDLTQYAVKEEADEGRPAYDPRSMFKLYIYGNREGICSSRELAQSCKVNIEVKWMTGGIEPDFRTISEFRKNNIDSLKKIFYEFNKRMSGAVERGFTSVAVSKFTHNKSKDANLTKNKLDDRIKRLNAHTDEYLRILKDTDEQEDLEEDLGVLTKESVEESGMSQLSLTDADTRLIKNGTEEMLARAKEGYFVRDPERNLVYCPNGEILRQKSIKKNGSIRYSNKNACRHCSYLDKCYKGKNGWKEIDFTKDCLEKPCQGILEAESTENSDNKQASENGRK